MCRMSAVKRSVPSIGARSTPAPFRCIAIERRRIVESDAHGGLIASRPGERMDCICDARNTNAGKTMPIKQAISALRDIFKQTDQMNAIVAADKSQEDSRHRRESAFLEQSIWNFARRPE